MTVAKMVCSGSKDNWFRIRILKDEIINIVYNGKYDSYNNFRQKENKICQITGIFYTLEQKNFPYLLFKR